MKDFFDELALLFAVVTETWFHSSPAFDSFVTDCRDRLGLLVEAKNRRRKVTSNANPGGGVAVIYDGSKLLVKPYPIRTRGFEVMCVQGKIPNNTRPLFIIGAYIPPKTTARKTAEFMETISEAILKIRSTSSNPYLVVAGDFNRRDIGEAFHDYPEVSVIQRLRRGMTRLWIYASRT